MEIEYPSGATPLDPDEINGLIPQHISTQSQLDEWEADNILKAEKWISSKSSHKNLLTIEFLKNVHKKMFGDTWKWAGSFRNSEKNIGVPVYEITTKLKVLLDNVEYQIVNDTYPLKEIAYRFHHTLVQIHPFPNGNGRHARLLTDVLLVETGEKKFTWGCVNLAKDSQIRKQYITSLQSADRGTMPRLLHLLHPSLQNS